MDKVEYDINNQVQKPEYDLSFILLGLVILFFIARGLYQLFMSRQEVYIVDPTPIQSTTVVDPDSGEVPGTVVETQNDTTVDNNSITTDVNNGGI